jgi:hypothetical protein
MTDDFLLRFKEFLDRNEWRSTSSPWDLIERWEQFVDGCSVCYQWGYYEFDNDVRVRTSLERVLSDPELARYPQLQEMRTRAEEADNRFRDLLAEAKIRSEQDPWWLRAVLARAGVEYSDDMKSMYNIDVLPC